MNSSESKSSNFVLFLSALELKCSILPNGWWYYTPTSEGRCYSTDSDQFSRDFLDFKLTSCNLIYFWHHCLPIKHDAVVTINIIEPIVSKFNLTVGKLIDLATGNMFKNISAASRKKTAPISVSSRSYKWIENCLAWLCLTLGLLSWTKFYNGFNLPSGIILTITMDSHTPSFSLA